MFRCGTFLYLLDEGIACFSGGQKVLSCCEESPALHLLGKSNLVSAFQVQFGAVKALEVLAGEQQVLVNGRRDERMNELCSLLDLLKESVGGLSLLFVQVQV